MVSGQNCEELNYSAAVIQDGQPDGVVQHDRGECSGWNLNASHLSITRGYPNISIRECLCGNLIDEFSHMLSIDWGNGFSGVLRRIWALSYF